MDKNKLIIKNEINKLKKKYCKNIIQLNNNFMKEIKKFNTKDNPDIFKQIFKDDKIKRNKLSKWYQKKKKILKININMLNILHLKFSYLKLNIIIIIMKY